MRAWSIRAASLIVAAGLLTVGPLAGAPGATAAQAASTLPVTISNLTGYTGKIYVTVYGSTNPANAGTWYYASTTGATVKFKPSTQPRNYGFSFSGKSTSIRVPMLQSARIYFSFCQPIRLTVAPNGNPSTPDGWNPGTENFDTQFESVEYTWIPNTGPGGGTQIWVNTTQVDAFGLPIRMMLSGKPNGVTTRLTGGFSSSTAGTNIITAITAAGSPWKKLVVKNALQRPIRIISPVHAMALDTKAANYFTKTYWNKYIDQVFTYYAQATKSFTIDTGTTTYTGKVKNNQMVLTPKGGGTPTVFAKPDSQYLWGNGAPPVSGGNVAELQKYIQASFLRSTFLTNKTLSSCSGATPYTSSPVNQYSKLIHKYAYKQEAYTFPYDDVCSQSSTTSLLQPTSLHLTLYPLYGSMATSKCPAP